MRNRRDDKDNRARDLNSYALVLRIRTCFAVNHILKLETNWKPEKVTDLVESIHRIVKLQYADVRHALHGQGNFHLAPHVQQFQVSHTNWMEKSLEERNNLFRAFMNYRPRKRALETTSTDGKLTIPVTPRLAKKLCQEVRACGAKTTTCFAAGNPGHLDCRSNCRGQTEPGEPLIACLQLGTCQTALEWVDQQH